MSCTTRTVVFLRHGVAHHNYPGAPLESPSLTDPSLRIEGKLGAVHAGHVIQHWLYHNRKEATIDLVVCSPLTRTLQTATLAFGLPGGDDYTTTTNPPPPPILCVENIREASGKHYPDKRRELSFLKKHWPMVAFDPTMSELDMYWSSTQRETVEQLERRIDAVVSWLNQRPEKCIVVVSHGVWMEMFLHKYSPHTLSGDDDDDDGITTTTKRVYNCDAYVTTMLSPKGKTTTSSSSSGDNINVRFENVQLIPKG